MNYIDALLVLVFAVCLIISVARGLTVSFMGFLGIMAGLFFAGEYYSIIGNILGYVISSKPANIIAYFIFCIGFILFFASAGLRCKKKIASISVLSWFDRFGGLFIGLIMFAFFCDVFQMVLLNHLSSGIRASIQNSRISSFLLNHVVDVVHPTIQYVANLIQKFP
jgi:uncharacterized membrane protein required for colicin V production